MQIRKLLEKIEYKLLAGNLDTEITSLVYDSRKVKEGALFVCIAGTVRDAHDFIPEIMGKGAVAFVVERDDIEFIRMSLGIFKNAVECFSWFTSVGELTYSQYFLNRCFSHIVLPLFITYIIAQKNC